MLQGCSCWHALQGLVFEDEGQQLLQRLVPAAPGSDQAECACAHVQVQLQLPDLGAAEAGQASQGASCSMQLCGVPSWLL